MSDYGNKRIFNYSCVLKFDLLISSYKNNLSFLSLTAACMNQYLPYDNQSLNNRIKNYSADCAMWDFKGLE